MAQEKKTKKCRRADCRKEFVPKKFWQKFCSAQCGYAERNSRRAKEIKRLKKFHEEHTGSAA